MTYSFENLLIEEQKRSARQFRLRVLLTLGGSLAMFAILMLGMAYL